MSRVISAELGTCLRTWRDRLGPADVGLPAGRGRRAPGLRREEVASLAGVSVDYLARLEQGRATHPSASVLAPLARALRLTDEERDHLYRLAGHAEPGPGEIDRHLSPGVQRILDRLSDVPVVVCDPAWQIVAANPLAQALLGDVTGEDERLRNIAWRHFTGMPSRVVRTAQQALISEVGMVADLRDACSRFPADGSLHALVEDLLAVSPRFAELWSDRRIACHSADRKTIRHPEVGDLTLDCDVLKVAGTDLQLIVYTAQPGSPDAEALALVSTIGLQTFA